MSLRVLVVEDEPLLAFDIAQHLATAGYRVVGPAASVVKALELIRREGCDLAVLDVNLGRETAEPIALELKGLCTPFLTLTGYSSDQHPPGFSGAPSLTKPATPEELVAELRRLLPDERA
jgi:DNA-binding response OmpR family regulator